MDALGARSKKLPDTKMTLEGICTQLPEVTTSGFPTAARTSVTPSLPKFLAARGTPADLQEPQEMMSMFAKITEKLTLCPKLSVPKKRITRWVRISALVEHLYSVKYEDFSNLPFHTRGFVRMVPLVYWAQMFIVAAIMEPDLQMACDGEGLFG